jgi:HEAT repeat protein
MPREQLLGLAADVERLLAAGATAAAGNDKLRQRAKTLRELGKQVPALVPVAAAIDKVVQASPKQAGPAFLDLVLRARQIRGGIAGYGVPGELEPIPESGPWQTPLSTRDVGVLHQALSGTGHGRETALREALENKSIGDLRLLDALLDAVEDTNATVADLAATEVLPSLGRAVLPDLTAKLNLQGKAADARRLKAIALIDKGLGAELCRKAVAEGSVPLKVQALELLPDLVPAAEAEKMGLQLLEDKNGEVRAAACSALRTAPSEEAFARLWQMTRDRSEPVQRAAFDALGGVRFADASPRLLAELRQAIDTLPAIPRAPKAEPQKKKGAKGKPAAKGQGKAAAKAKPAKPELTPQEQAKILAKRRKQLNVISRLTAALGRRNFDAHRKAVADAVVELASFKDEDVRWTAVRALGTLGPANDQVLPTLTCLLHDKKSQVVWLAVEALASMEPAGRSPVIPEVVAVLRQPGQQPRTYQTGLRLLLPHLKEHGKTVLGVIEDVLAFKDQWVAQLACEVAGELGPAALPIVKRVVALVARPSYYWSGPLFNHIVRIDPAGTEALPLLGEMLRDKRADVRVRALQAIATYGATAKPLRDAIAELAAKDRTGYVKTYAENTLRAIEGVG